MKKLGKILAVLLVMALVLCGVVLTVSADEPATASATPAAPDFLPVSVTVQASQIDADALDGMTYLVYASEADFNADLADGLLDGEADGEFVLEDYGDTADFTMPTTSAYVYLLADVTAKQTGTIPNATIQINFGDNKMTFPYTSGYWQNAAGLKLAMFNGKLEDLSHGSGHGAFRITASNYVFALRDLVINSNMGYGNTELFAVHANGSFYLEDIVASYSNAAGKSLFQMNGGAADVTLVNVDFTAARTMFAGGSKLTLRADADCSFKGTVINAAVTDGSVTLAPGIKVDEAAKTSLEAVSPITGGASFVNSGDATYPYLLLRTPDVTKLNYDEGFVAEKGGYLVYETEMDFLLDFDENNKIDGSTAIGSGSGTADASGFYNIVLPTSGYVYMLDNCVTSTAVSGIDGLYINCGGKILKQINGLIQAQSMTIFNGTYIDNWNHNSDNIRPNLNSGAVITFKDMKVQIIPGWGNTATIYAYAATINLENIEVEHTGGRTALVMTQGWESTVNLKNVTYKGTGTNATYPCGLVYANDGHAKVNADANTKVIAGHLINSGAQKTTRITVKLELGFRAVNTANFDNIATLNASGSNTVTYTEGGVATAATGVKFALDGDTYLLQKPGSVSWYAKDGSLIKTDVLYTDGFNAPAIDMIITKTESGYTFATAAWTLDGEAFDLSTRIEPGKTYELREAESAAKAATLVLLENGVATNAWDITALTNAFVGELPENSTLLVLADMAVSGDSIGSYKNGVVIDLCDNTLTMDGYYFVTPAAGATVTIKNGKLVKSTNNVTVFGNAAGTLILNSVDITTPYAVAELKMGSLVMQLCNIDSQSTRPYYIGNGTATTNASLELLGIKHIMPDPLSGSVFITLNGALGNISVRVADYEGVYSNIKAGYFFQFTGNGTNATEGVTKLNFEFENVYVSGYNNLVTGDIAWSGAANPELTNANVSFTFNNFLGTRSDYFNDALTAAATVNVTKVKNTYESMTDPEHDDYASTFLSPNPTYTGMMMNLTLYSDFNLNIYIPVDTDIAGIKFGGEWLFYPAENIGTDEVVDGFYKVSIKKIAPNEAAKYVELGIWYTDTATYLDGSSMSYYYNFTAKYSIVKYVASVIAEEDETIVSKAAKDNAMALAAYVKATYDYFTENAESDAAVMAQLEALVTEEVLALVNSFVAADDANDFVNAKVNAVFTSDATTKLSLTFEDGVAWTVNGRSGVGGTYVVNLRAYNLCDTLTITAGGETATFSLGEYVAVRIAGGATGTELAALQALYAYGMTAQALKPLN